MQNKRTSVASCKAVFGNWAFRFGQNIGTTGDEDGRERVKDSLHLCQANAARQGWSGMVGLRVFGEVALP